MADYFAPGVYVEEVPSAVKPIAGVGTSTAGFVGIAQDIVAADMPLNPGGGNYTQATAGVAQPINGWEEFRKKFGDFCSANQYLAHAVYGFFNNGGTRCWVIRVTSVDDVSAGVDKFNEIDEIAIVAAPLPPDTDQAALNAVHAKLVSHCQLLEDRVAILDCARDIANDNLVISTDNTGIWRPSANPKGYGAFYFPWIEVSDPLASAGTRIAVPPSGHMAGIYARSDAQRGVHKAPANEVVMGALGLKYRVSKPLQASLNPVAINCIREFNGTIKVWGARTLASDPSGDPEWKYINVRRLINYIRESIDEGTQWVVFEPNDMALWAKINRNVTAFLTNVWRAGALFGSTPQQAFYVKCDSETNPQEVRDLGQVVTEIGVAVVKPAEFVIFRISQWAGPSK
ncbi:phage tail sheath protein [Geobacter sp. OR-1]|uniref:phage tail sheath family protein n=1 Tax=Geobacter sp. OR-1 TaxID=1266765 RepID=UPI0005419F93|nr:phage tail sheath C-terminal domain-containing protein [Geobacter sp. OR-1]GAM10184.1 phage tail sheath protein [Geobacter sp. OR-1]